MHPFWLVLALTTLLAAPYGCGGDDDDGGGDAPFGAACSGDDVCADHVCFEGTCSRPCTEYDQCPAGTICGNGDDRVICVTFEADEDHVGVNCSNNEGACEAGTECRSRGADDPDAVCSNACDTDRDCPKQWFCSVGPADEEHAYCQPRGFCDGCNVDDDCRYGEDDCIEGDDGLKFCSFVCDPDPSSSTCPVDSECREVAGHGFQCVPAAGGCTGDGGLCEPCRLDSDCDNGSCLYDRRAQVRLCGQDCDAQRCPPGFDCVNIDGEDTVQCYPRVLVVGAAQTQACTRPSGGGRTCDPCVGHADCETGTCITFQTGNYCGDDCSTEGCGPWAVCQDFNGGALQLCTPEGTLTCGEYYRCSQDCDPGDECNAGECG